jgi:uncharacterized membrane protein (DUF4010 family)
LADFAAIQESIAPFGISLGVGLLVGLQRERAGSRLGGVRTFPLIALLGTLSGMVGAHLGGWIVGAGLLAVVIAMTAANFMILTQEGERGAGLTSEISILLMYVLGAYAAFGEPWVVLAVGAVVAILLFFKPGLHSLADKIGDKDMRAIMLFAAITFVVLPVLPDAEYGPYNVWNPRLIWLVVVLVVGISLGGYIAYKALGGRGGTLVAGVLGGLISSTATTVGHARRAASAPELRGPALLVIAIATCISYARVLVEIGVVAPQMLNAAGLPIGVMALTAVIATYIAWTLSRKNGSTIPEPENPTQLRSALVFAAIFAMVLLAVGAAKEHLGTRGIYGVSALAGLVNLDAITVSNAQMGEQMSMAATAWRAIVVAIMANLVFKLALVWLLGSKGLLWRLGLVLGAQIAAGAIILTLWPRGL